MSPAPRTQPHAVPAGPVLMAAVCGGVFLLLEGEPKLLLLLILLLAGLLVLLGLAYLGLMRPAMLCGLGFAVIINPRKYFGLTDASELLGGAAGYIFVTLLDVIVLCLCLTCARRVFAAMWGEGGDGLSRLLRLLLLGFVFCTAASFLNATHMQHAWAQLVFECKSLLLFFTVFAVLTDPTHGGVGTAARPLLYGLCGGMVVEAGVAVAEYARLIGTGGGTGFLGIMVGSFSETLESGMQAFRVGGTYQHPNYLAMPAAALLLVCWQVQTDACSAVRSTFWVWLGFAAALVCVVLPFSRGGWLGVCCGGLVYVGVMLASRGRAWLKGLPWRTILAVCALGLIVALRFADQIYDKLFHSSPLNMLSRYDLNAMTLEMIRDHPWLGVGAGNHSYGAEGYGRYAELAAVAGLPPMVHNVYLLIASDIGLPGAMCFFGVPLLVMLYGARTCVRWPRHRLTGLVCACVSALAVFLVGDFFGASLRKVDVAYLYWLLLAMGMAAAVTVERDGAAGNGEGA